MEQLNPATGGASANIVDENLAKLRELFPDAFTESSEDGEPRWKVDFDALREVLGDAIEDKPERYSFTWNGKSRAKLIANTPTTATLRPCPEESVDWDTTKNLFIEGDNLEVLKLLQKSYHRKIKLIYIDPPYNTGKEFIYPDKFHDNLDTYLRYSGQTDGDGLKLTANTDTSGRYHTNWLNMMLPRLKLGRHLLRNDGVFLASINDKEYANLRRLCDEVFGEECFVGNIVWKGATDNNPTQIAIEHEYVLCYCKDAEAVKGVWKSRAVDAKQSMLSEYERLNERHVGNVDLIKRDFRLFVRNNSPVLSPLTHYTQIDERGVFTGSRKVHNPKPGGYEYDIEHPVIKKTCVAPANGYRYPEPRMRELLEQDRVIFGDDETQIVQIKEYLSDFQDKLSSVIRLDSRAGANEIGRLFGDRKVFTNPKPHELLERLFSYVVDDGDIVMDFFAGSCATAHAVQELNENDGGHRQFVMVQLPEALDANKAEQKPAARFCTANGLPLNIAEVAKERLRRLHARASEDTADPTLLDTESSCASIDRGFRVFTLDSSNLRPWDSGLELSDDELYDLVDNFKRERSEQDVLYELLLKYGLDLSEPIEHRELVGSTVFNVGAGALIVCLAKSIDLDVVEGIVALKEELKPEVMRVVFRDSGFKDDVVKANAVQILKQAGLADEQIRSL